MGSQKKNEEQEIELVDFLYKDTSYIDSFYSQIFQGDLHKISKNNISKETTENKLTAGLSVIKGNIGANSENVEGITEEILPHDSKIIKLFDELVIRSCNSTKESKINSINKFHGTLEILDNENLKKQFNVLDETGLLEVALEAANASNKVDGIDNQTMTQLLAAMMKLLTNGCDIILTLNNNEKILVPIDRNYLTMKVEDILRVYGNFIPSEWIIIGIYDCTRHQESSNTIEAAMKEVQVQMDNAFSIKKPTSVLKPIAIYRKLK